MAIVLGILVGAVCAMPMLYVLKASKRGATRLGFARVLACGVAPLLVLQVAALVVWRVKPDAAPSFGVAAALALLATVSAGVFLS